MHQVVASGSCSERTKLRSASYLLERPEMCFCVRVLLGCVVCVGVYYLWGCMCVFLGVRARPAQQPYTQPLVAGRFGAWGSDALLVCCLFLPTHPTSTPPTATPR